MSIKKVLEQLKKREFDVVRVILLSRSFAFNLDIEAFKKIRDDKEKGQALRGLVYQYRLPKNFILNYTKTQSLNIDDLETQLCAYEIYDNASDGERNIIDQEGIYIKFDPGKTDRFYKKVIKRLRSYYEFLDASEEDKKRFVKEGGKSAYLYNAKTKASQKRRQGGSNFEQDITIYLMCEEAIENMLTDTNFVEDINRSEAEKADSERYLFEAIEIVAEDSRLTLQQTKNIYYEVCRRYKLPTLTKNPYSIDL